VIAGMLIAALMLSGCATSTIPGWQRTAYGTWKFSHADIEKLPIISIRNILSAISEDELQRIQVFVRARNLDGLAKVTRMAGEEEVFVADPHGEEVRINLAQITEIRTVRYIKVTPRHKTTGEKAEEAVVFLEYAPFIPVAIATWPILRVSGLDAGKNAEDTGKASMAYGGMSKEDLITYIGEPMEEYYCEGKHGDEEIWIYEKSQVLRGGRALFINLDDGVVYHTSHNTTFFKDSNSLNCSVLRR